MIDRKRTSAATRGPVDAILIVLFLAACTNLAPTPNVSPKRTAGSVGLAVADATVDPATCPSARVEGTLVEDAETGLGLLEPSGRQWHIVWPSGYSAGPSIGGTNLFGASGDLLARSGENLRIGGVVPAGNLRWMACGEIVKVPF